MIVVRPFDSLSAIAVFRQLDTNDQLEAEIVRGAPVAALDLFADWRAASGACWFNHVIQTRAGASFAVLALAPTGQHGVAQAALLARNHHRFRRHIAALALRIRREMPVWSAQHGVNRIEARAWADHPSASRFLTAIGFQAECDMPGFGPGGTATFRQFAWMPQEKPLAPVSPGKGA